MTGPNRSITPTVNWYVHEHNFVTGLVARPTDGPFTSRENAQIVADEANGMEVSNAIAEGRGKRRAFVVVKATTTFEEVA